MHKRTVGKHGLIRRLKNKWIRGFTLIESLVVVGILGLLVGVTVTNLNILHTFDSANDAKRKSDVEAIYKSLTQYYIETQCVPGHQDWDNFQCNAPVPSKFQPYFSGLPCDPVTGEKYYVEFFNKNCHACNGDCGNCTGIRVLTKLANPVGSHGGMGAGCDEVSGCGVLDSTGEPYNYGIGGNSTCMYPTPTSGVTPTSAITSSPTIIPSKTPAPTLIPPTSTPTQTPSPKPTATPTITPSPIPTLTPTPIITACTWNGIGNIAQNGSFEVATSNIRLPDCWRLQSPSAQFLADEGRICGSGATAGSCIYSLDGWASRASVLTTDEIWQMNTVSGNAGDTITFSFDVKASHQSSPYPSPSYSGGVRLIRADGTNEIIRIWQNTFPENTWTHFSASQVMTAEGVTSPTATRPYIRIDIYLDRANLDNRTYWVDNVQVIRT